METPDNPEIEELIEEAHLQIVRGEYDSARATLIRIHQIQPDDPESQKMLAQIPAELTSTQLDDARIEQDKDEYYKRRQQYDDAQFWNNLGDGWGYHRRSFIFDALFDLLGPRY